MHSFRHVIIKFSSVVLLSLIFLTSIPLEEVEAASYPEIILQPGAPFWFELEDYDREGDEVTLTVLFLKKSDGTFQERPIDIMILRTSLIRGTPNMDTLSEYSMYHFQYINRSIRDQKYENMEGGKMSILFLNHEQDGDNSDEAKNNTNVRIRVDYFIENAPEESGVDIGKILIILFVVIGIVGLVLLGFYLIKRKIRDRSTFFNTSQSGFYVFRDIDDSIYYFTPMQYAKMYSSNSLVTYEYLGQASKKGGPILNPSAQMAQAQPVQAQPMTPVPLEAQPMMAQQYGGDPVVDTTPVEPVEDTYGEPLSQGPEEIDNTVAEEGLVGGDVQENEVQNIPQEVPEQTQQLETDGVNHPLNTDDHEKQTDADASPNGKTPQN